MIRTDKKGNRSVEVANPDLGCAGVEIEGAFFVDLGYGIRRRKDLDANVGRVEKHGWVLTKFGPLRSEPGDIDGSDSGGGGNRALGNAFPRREQLKEQSSYLDLPTAMSRSGWGTHEDAAVLIGLDAIWELSKLRISQDLGPASLVKPGLSREVRKLNSDWHRGIYAKNAKGHRYERNCQELPDSRGCRGSRCLPGLEACAWPGSGYR
jgi:hypothetical protein